MLAALFSSMSVWAYRLTDIRLSLNDFYMGLLMTGWMFLLEGLMMSHRMWITIGFALIVVSLYLIRTQAFINVNQYIQGMIPHHSMAILMSDRLIEKYGPNVLDKIPRQIIQSQDKEIAQFKLYN